MKSKCLHFKKGELFRRDDVSIPLEKIEKMLSDLLKDFKDKEVFERYIYGKTKINDLLDKNSELKYFSVKQLKDYFKKIDWLWHDDDCHKDFLCHNGIFIGRTYINNIPGDHEFWNYYDGTSVNSKSRHDWWFESRHYICKKIHDLIGDELDKDSIFWREL